MVRQALRQAPELAQLDQRIAAQKRLLLSAKLSFVVPTVGFGFSLEHLLAKGGGEPVDPASLGQFGALLSAADDTNWTAAFSRPSLRPRPFCRSTSPRARWASTPRPCSRW